MTDVELTEAQLASWGEALGRGAEAGPVFVALYGELGAGKSTLVRAACRGLGVAGSVPSPTFSLVNRHEGADGPILHADLYRLEPPITLGILVDAGWPELIEADGPVFVEWADRAADWLPPDRWDVRLRVTGAATRAVTIETIGSAPRPPSIRVSPC